MGVLYRRVRDAKQELQDLVQTSAIAAGDRRRGLRKRAPRVRRRIARMSALRQLLAGPRGRVSC